MARAPNKKAEQAKQMYLQGAKQSDIAKALEVPEGTVRRWKCTYSWDSERSDKKKANARKQSRQKKEPPEPEVNVIAENAELTDKQKLFCALYIKCFNGVKAYQKAYGCSYGTAAVNGCRLLKNANIKAEIQKLKQNRLNREMLDESDIVQKYIDIAFADMTDFVEFGTEKERVETKNPETGEEEILTRIVNVVRFREAAEVDGTLIAAISNGKAGPVVKLADRMQALRWLADHMDLATEEQRARIASLRAKLGDEAEETADDGFLKALEGMAEGDWMDEEED